MNPRRSVNITVPDGADAAEAEVVVRPLEHVVDDVLGKEPAEDVVDSCPLEVVEPFLGQPRVDPRAEDHGIERLREVVVGPDLDAADDALGLVDGGDHDHRDVTRIRRRLEPLEDRDAVELGHDDVEEHDVDRLVGEQLERLRSVCRGADRMAVLLEEASEQLPADAVVVGDEDRGATRASVRSSPRRAAGSTSGRRLERPGGRCRLAQRGVDMTRTA